MRRFKGFTLVLALSSLLLGGCATSRSVVAPQVAVSSGSGNGPAVRIEKIEDQRTFEIAPSSPDIPSLSDDNIADKATTTRAIARKRNGYGKAMGDVLLPEQQTVAGLVQTAIEQGFREAGYRVVSKGDPGYDSALPVSASVRQFWAWMNPGFWAIALEQRSEIVVRAPLKPLENGATVNGHVRESMQFAGEGAWNDIVTKGLADLVRNLKSQLENR